MASDLNLKPSLEKKLMGHRKGITALHFSPNERQLATSSLDSSVMVWDIHGPVRSYRFQGHTDAVMDVTYSPSGKYMASASRDKTVRLWIPTVTGSTAEFRGHSQTVRSVQFSQDSKKILTASDDKIIKLWSTERQKFISSFVGHTNWVKCARLSSDGSVIASCADDKTVKLWSIDSGQCLHTYHEKKACGLYVAWHPSGCYIAVASTEGSVKLYDTRTHNLKQYYSIHNEEVSQVAFHPSGNFLLTCSKDNKMKILDLLEGHPIYTLTGHNGPVSAVNFTSSGDTFASGGDDKQILIWKTNFTYEKEEKENVTENNSSTFRTNPKTSAKINARFKDKPQGSILWNKCYHYVNYPTSKFVNLEVSQEDHITDVSLSTQEHPNANSTFRNNIDEPRSFTRPSVSDMSHIPRTPPSPNTYTVPSIVTDEDNEMFGMISLRSNDVCYTSGTIEWVGKKRNFSIGKGFKLIHDRKNKSFEPQIKRQRTKLNKPESSFQNTTNTLGECNCVNVLPTVNAIVDHLNALHEAVDIVDLRLNTIEHVMRE